jgi:fermentation-respiration switch protein FrsA (DUF1100 family)
LIMCQLFIHFLFSLLFIMNPQISSASFQLLSKKENRPFVDVSFLKNGKEKPFVVFVHGFKGFKDWGPFNRMATYFAGHGFVFVKFNLSHNGTTPEFPVEFADLEAFGKDNHSIQLDDLGLVLDWIATGSKALLEEEGDPKKIYLIGHSRGGSLVLLKGAEDSRVQKIIIWAAVSDLLSGYSPEELQQWKKEGVRWIHNARTNQQMPVYYQYMEDLQVNAKRLNVLKASASLKQPLLIIHAENDETVPLHHATAIHQQAGQSELIIIQKTNHTFGGVHPFVSATLPDSLQQLYDTSIQFLKK